MPPYNKGGISRFLLIIPEIAEIFQKLQISSKRYSSFSSYFDHSEIFTGETRHIVPPYNKAGISNFCLEFQKLQKYSRNARFLDNATSPLVLIRCILKFCTGETRYIVPPYNKAGISNFCLEFQKLQKF